MTRCAPVVAAVALGSNLGDRERTLADAVRELSALPHGRVLSRSSWHETEAVGGPRGQPRYLNGAVLLETRLPARDLLAELLAIEARAGRTRRPGRAHEPRTLDLDLVTYGAAVLDEPGLCVPHPRAEERAFVLAPLAEIAPDLVLARSGRTVRAALQALATAGRRAASRA